MNSDKLIFDIHSAFLLEYSQASTCLSEFYKTVNLFFSRIITENEEHPDEPVEGNIRSIQEICFFLKTFCSEIELHTQLLKSKLKDEPKTIKDEHYLENGDIEYSPPENPNEIYPFELYPDIFTYEMVDPSKFVIGHEEEFFVSFIKDEASQSFFLMSTMCSKIAIGQTDFRYDIIPSKGTVFGILLDGSVVRAVRENSLQKQPKSFKVLLIDFGEIVEITKDFKMYQLPEEIQQIPGQAIFCKLTMDDNDNSFNADYLRDKLHTKQNVRVDRIYKNMLEVTFVVSSTIKPLPDSISKDSNLNILCNGTIPKNHMTASTSKDVNLPPPPPTTSFNQHKTGHDSLTQEELDELYEEPLNTENALEAVMGYTPQDEKRICKFYNPKTNACFKGADCKLEHTTILKDGWTKDQRAIKMKVHSEIPLPKVGKKINIFVSYVVDVDRFYGQIIPKNCKNTNELIADEIFEKMNTPEVKLKFKRFSQPPGELELVFAMFEGDWYRARVLQKFSDINYRVFYVDYGNCATITLNEMRQWDDSFDRYPFQALEFRLDNIKKLKELDDKAIAYFESLVLIKSVTATVTSNVGSLLVTLQGLDKFDIGEQLCAAQFAKAKQITRFDGQQVPG